MIYFLVPFRIRSSPLRIFFYGITMKRTKYPRTFNLPWSGSESSDDVWWKNCTNFEDKEVVITEKMDGECTTIYPDCHVHARSIDTVHHPSRSWIKSLAARIAHDIPEGYRICGENVFAWHSVFYTELPTYFFVYGIYEGEKCLSWDEVDPDGGGGGASRLEKSSKSNSSRVRSSAISSSSDGTGIDGRAGGGVLSICCV